MSYFVDGLDDCIVTAEAITTRTHFTRELPDGYVAIWEDQHTRLCTEKGKKEMSSITYQPGTISSLVDGGGAHEDFHVLRDGQATGLGYFLDPAPNRASNTFGVQVDGGKVSNVTIHRTSDDQDWYVLVHVSSGMTFHQLFQTEAQVKQHAEALLALGLDWTQPVEVLQQHPLWKDLGRLNKEIVARILGKQRLL